MDRFDRLLLLLPYARAHHALLSAQFKRDVFDRQREWYSISSEAGFDPWDYADFTGWDYTEGDMPTDGVYSLSDESGFFYVGRSGNIERRVWDHILSTVPALETIQTPMNLRQTMVAAKIIRCLKADHPITATILSEDQNSEDFWIMTVRAAGAWLCNMT